MCVYAYGYFPMSLFVSAKIGEVAVDVLDQRHEHIAVQGKKMSGKHREPKMEIKKTSIDVLDQRLSMLQKWTEFDSNLKKNVPEN